MTDVTVIGAGAAGCAAARRLSEDPEVSVTLLEAGGTTDRPDVQAPPAWPSLMGGDLDYATLSVPQRDADGRRFMLSRGRGLGGSTVINAMIHSLPNTATLDSWPETLSSMHLARVIDLIEQHSADANATGTTEHRGTNGLVASRQALEPNAVSTAFIESCLQAGYPALGDPNRAGARGAGLFDLSIDPSGRRADAYGAYLTPMLDRPNLEVVTGAEVTRLEISDGRVTALQVPRDGRTETIPISGDVLLCTGTVATPVLLMRSGIGPAADLRAAGIKVIIDSAAVGQNLHDHPMIPVVYSSERPIAPPTNQLFEALLYLPHETSVDGHTISAAVGHIPFPLPGLPSPEFGITALVGTYTPRSRGMITLDPADPNGDPLIDPSYLSESTDVKALVAGLSMVREIFTQDALAAFGLKELFPGPTAVDEEELAAAVRAGVSSFYHPVGTCRAGDDPESVVDGQMRLRGLENVRIADMSIAPIVPEVATSVAAQFIGWRTAEVILEDGVSGEAATKAAERQLADSQRRAAARKRTHPATG